MLLNFFSYKKIIKLTFKEFGLQKILKKIYFNLFKKTCNEILKKILNNFVGKILLLVKIVFLFIIFFFGIFKYAFLKLKV